MNALKKKYSILIAEDHADYQFLYKMALAEIDPEIEINMVYSTEQVVEYLIKDKLHRSLNRQAIPTLVIIDVKPPFSDLEQIKSIRLSDRFKKIPIYAFAEVRSNFLDSTAKDTGINEVLLKPYTFYDLKELLQNLIQHNPARRLTKSLFCSRCEEYIEFDNDHGQFANHLIVSPPEAEFIKGRFNGALCIPCINQLKTSYKILNGEFNGESKKVTKN